jgi:crotonobetainyl-CoA:carnitine CoA-transferase CaiB-like acyl-CoA transferase
VYTIPELVSDAHFASRNVFMEAEHPEHGRFRQVGPVLAGGARAQPVHRMRPHAETDTDRLLTGAGMSEQEIAKLRRDGIVE